MIWQKIASNTLQRPVFPTLTLSSARIYMRPPALDDWSSWAKIRARSQKTLRPFEPQWHEEALTHRFFQARLLRQSREWQEGRAQAYFIFTHDNTLIGGMNINNICRGAAQYASLGYWLDKDAQGQGYMFEALTLTLHHCFKELKLHRVNASVLPHNGRSKKVLLKAGFKEEGFAEKYLQINGKWEDHILLGLSVERWADLSGAKNV